MKIFTRKVSDNVITMVTGMVSGIILGAAITLPIVFGLMHYMEAYYGY